LISYVNGELFAENVNVAKIAEAVGTSVYIYSKVTFHEYYSKYASMLLKAYIFV
jgi:diaminopimelate decarboxylase